MGFILIGLGILLIGAGVFGLFYYGKVSYPATKEDKKQNSTGNPEAPKNDPLGLYENDK